MEAIKDMKRRGESLKKGRESHYYIRKYDDVSVADILLVLEDENWHTAETLLETIAHMDYYGMLEACKLILEHDEKGHFTDDMYKRQKEIDDRMRKEENEKLSK